MVTSLDDEFARALEAIEARVCFPVPEEKSIAIAYSGGLDSSVLLCLAQRYAQSRSITLFAFHIHHGLSPNADAWLQHCESGCAATGIAFDAQRVALQNISKSGTEESARLSRYAALGGLCRKHAVPLLLTAHHRDDQAETVLLQMLRGSGVAGLSGMDTANTAADLLGDPALIIGRPLLNASRAQLEEYAARHAITYINDESNADTRYARNALRHHVMPELNTYFPGFQERVARVAQHAQSAQRLLQQLAKADFDQCASGACLDVERLRQLDTDRLDNLLRYWLGMRNMRMPSTAWLEELRDQLLDAKDDAQLCVTHPDGHVRRYRNRVFLTRRYDNDPSSVAPETFCWNGEAEIHFPAYDGTLLFEPAEQGIDSEWLKHQTLQLRYRQGGEKVKLAPNRPTRTLKQHYQALDVPAWERERLPLVVTGERLLFAAGIGMDCHYVGSTEGSPVRLGWKAA